MKRLILVVAIILVVGIGTAFAYADSPIVNKFTDSEQDSKFYEKMTEWHNKMMGNRREGLNKALEEGKITKEEASTWEEHFDDMEEFHEENGFMGNGYGGCHGRRGSRMRMRHGRGF